MKKIIVLVLVFVILFKINTVSAQCVTALQPETPAICGPIPAASTCPDPIACGNKECILAYDTLEKPASSVCTASGNAAIATGKSCASTADSTCSGCISACTGPQAPACISTCGSIHSGQISTCAVTRDTQIQAASSQYQSQQFAASEAGITAQTVFTTSGAWASLPCSNKEISNCFASGSVIKLDSFSLLACENLNDADLQKALGEAFKQDPNEALKTMNPKYKSTLSQIYPDTPPTFSESVLSNPENIAKMEQPFFDKVALNQPSAFANTNVQQAVLDAGYSFQNSDSAKAVFDYIAQHGTNTPGSIFDDVSWTDALSLSSLIPTPEAEQSENAYPYQPSQSAQTASTAISGISNGGNTPVTVAAQNIFCQNIITCLEPRLLPSARDPIILFSSIHILFDQRTVMYTISGRNDGIAGVGNAIQIDDEGITRIDIVENREERIIDASSNRIILGPGTTTYQGITEPDSDVYTTNTRMYNVNNNVILTATLDTSGNEFGKVNLNQITGNLVTNVGNELELGVSYDNYRAPNKNNAIDISQTPGGYQIDAEGFGDLVLLGENKFFPLFVRVALKGDTSIVFNKNVRVSNLYVAGDNRYRYTIVADDDSTEVIARNNKIIQDSTGIQTGLSERQQRLVYT